jgi:hypothetical protein
MNRERAGLMGVKVGDVTRSLVAATTSSRFTVPNFWADPGSGVSYSVQVQVPQAETKSLEDVGTCPVPEANRSVLLRNVASVNAGHHRGPIRPVQHGARGQRHGQPARLGFGACHEGTRGHAGDQRRQTMAGPHRVDVRGQTVPLRQLMGGFQAGLGVAVRSCS